MKVKKHIMKFPCWAFADQDKHLRAFRDMYFLWALLKTLNAESFLVITMFGRSTRHGFMKNWIWEACEHCCLRHKETLINFPQILSTSLQNWWTCNGAKGDFSFLGKKKKHLQFIAVFFKKAVDFSQVKIHIPSLGIHQCFCGLVCEFCGVYLCSLFCFFERCKPNNIHLHSLCFQGIFFQLPQPLMGSYATMVFTLVKTKVKALNEALNEKSEIWVPLSFILF